MNIKHKKGQSTVEYVLLVTAVLAVIIALVTGNKSGFQTKLNSTLGQAVNDMDTLSSTLADSHNPSAAPTSTNTSPYIVSVLNATQ
jgi:hypothetical protein